MINMCHEYQKYMLYCATYLFTPKQNTSQRDLMLKRFGKSLVWACNEEQVYSKINSMFEVGSVVNCSVTLCPSNTVKISEYDQLLYCEQLPIETIPPVTVSTKHRYIGKEVEILIRSWEFCLNPGAIATVIDVISDDKGEPIVVVVDLGTKNENELFPYAPDTSIQTMYIGHVRFPK